MNFFLPRKNYLGGLCLSFQVRSIFMWIFLLESNTPLTTSPFYYSISGCMACFEETSYLLDLFFFIPIIMEKPIFRFAHVYLPIFVQINKPTQKNGMGSSSGPIELIYPTIPSSPNSLALACKSKITSFSLVAIEPLYKYLSQSRKPFWIAQTSSFLFRIRGKKTFMILQLEIYRFLLNNNAACIIVNILTLMLLCRNNKRFAYYFSNLSLMTVRDTHSCAPVLFGH